MDTPSTVLDDFAAKPGSSSLADLNHPSSLGVDGWSTSIDSLTETFAENVKGQWSVAYIAVCR
jgi:hypothetical protein